MEIKINCDDKQVQGVIRSLTSWFDDFTPLLKDISKVQLKSADESFKTRGTNLGKSWASLKIATTRQKLRIWKNIDILQRTGKMRKSFKVLKLTKNELEIENTVNYFKFHQIWTKKMPQRQMLGHSPSMIKRHEIATIDYILKLIQKWMK